MFFRVSYVDLFFLVIHVNAKYFYMLHITKQKRKKEKKFQRNVDFCVLNLLWRNRHLFLMCLWSLSLNFQNLSLPMIYKLNRAFLINLSFSKIISISKMIGYWFDENPGKISTKRKYYYSSLARYYYLDNKGNCLWRQRFSTHFYHPCGYILGKQALFNCFMENWIFFIGFGYIAKTIYS